MRQVQLVQRDSIGQHAPVIGPVETEEQAHERALSRPVRAEQRNVLTGTGRQIDPAQRRLVLVGERDALELERPRELDTALSLVRLRRVRAPQLVEPFERLERDHCLGDARTDDGELPDQQGSDRVEGQ